ncbi:MULTISPECIES: glycosyltransferase [unclassified Cupriavidus]|uniref:glycosyltransferase n=1 Tax=unclassified Cupriavidus TaxID=2640874 RepID=UPI0010F804FB|nr:MULTISPECIES: glycosyltransferase [unclassified Cupriavidus]MWL88194.1 glycosyltransferase [Cupriavidus sp. SW-Y-13]
MRILLVVTGLKVGGAEHQVVALAREFLRLGHTVAILSLSPGREIEPPVDAHVVELNMRKTPAGMVRALGQARALIHNWRPDVMHAHMVHANLFARALTRITRCPPLVCTGHSFREGGRLRMLAYRATDRWTRLTTHVSSDGRQGMIATGAVPAQRIVVMPNGIDTYHFQPDPALRHATRAQLGIDGNTRLLLNVGRLAPEKSQETLIRAFAQIDPAVRARLFIAGDGALRQPLSELVTSLGLASSVTLLGRRDDISALLNAADAFALSSNVEGLPMVLVEALACGCPVVSTNAPGVAEVVGELGTVVPRGDVRALAMSLAKTLRDGRGTHAEQAARRDRVLLTFSIDTVAQRWLALYARLPSGAVVPATETA